MLLPLTRQLDRSVPCKMATDDARSASPQWCICACTDGTKIGLQMVYMLLLLLQPTPDSRYRPSARDSLASLLPCMHPGQRWKGTLTRARASLGTLSPPSGAIQGTLPFITNAFVCPEASSLVLPRVRVKQQQCQCVCE